MVYFNISEKPQGVLFRKQEGKMIKKIVSIAFAVVLLNVFVLSSIYCDIPRTLSFQGRLTDNNDTPSEGSHSFGFAIYNSSSGGALLWSENQTLTLSDGIYNCVLGSVSAFPAALDFNAPYYLQVTVDGEALPRQTISSSAYALNAGRLGGIASSDFIYKSANGNVGIGTINPGKKLDVNGTARATQFELPGGGFWTEDSNTNFTFRTAPNKAMILDFGDTLQFRDSESSYAQRFYIDANGNVGIGTAAPGAKLDVNGSFIVRMNPADLNPCRISGFGNPHNYMDIQSGRGADGTYRDIRIATGAWPNWNGEQLYLKGNGNVGIGTAAPAAKLDVNADTLRLRNAKTPSRSTDTGNKGDICWDSNYVYVCVENNTWKRSNLSSW